MPEVVILGSAQDGGVPHAGCLCPACSAAREDVRNRRRPASIGIRAGDDWLIVDPTMAFEEQMHMLWTRRPSSAVHSGERYRPPEAIIVTHAHTGHYTGLWQLDKSVLAAPGVQVIAPPRTAALLGSNEPWRQMEKDGYVVIQPAAWDTGFEAVEGVSVALIEVPHRSEWPTDTAAVRIEGPSSTVLYLPDIDFWDDWERDIAVEAEAVDFAILDGSFWAAPTSPNVPHPPIRETMDRLQAVADTGETRIIFSHLNHSNPALLPCSPEAQEIARRGFEVAVDGMSIEI